jgi:hypothetical protein
MIIEQHSSTAVAARRHWARLSQTHWISYPCSLPLQGVALILGVDALMDMARTSLNVLGNCLASVRMARCDGSFALSADLFGSLPDLPSNAVTIFSPLEGATICCD